MRQSMERARRETRAATSTTDQMNTSMQQMARTVSLLRTGLIGLGAGYVLRSLTGVATSMQRMAISLQFATGSAAAAQKEMAWLRQEADRLGQNFLSSGIAFSKLAAGASSLGLGMTEVRKIFTGVGSAAAVMGLSADQAQGAFLALQQMIAKGSVQAEELRGQLGERIPTAFADAAQAMGMTTRQLSKALEQGEVEARDFVGKLADLWAQKFGSQIPSATESTQKAIQELDNAFDALKIRLVDAGFMEGLIAGMMALTDAMSSDGLYQAADAVGKALGQIGTGFAGLVEVGAEVAGVMASIVSPLLDVVDAFDALSVIVIAMVARHLAGLIASLATTAVMTIKTTTAFIQGRASLIGWARAAGGATASARALSLALVGGKGLIGVLGGPLGIALTVAGTAFALLGTRTETATGLTEDYSRELSILAGNIDGAADAQGRLADATERTNVAMMKQAIERAKADRDTFEGQARDALGTAADQIGKLGPQQFGRLRALGLGDDSAQLLADIAAGGERAALAIDRIGIAMGRLKHGGAEARERMLGYAEALRVAEANAGAADLRMKSLEDQLLASVNASTGATAATKGQGDAAGKTAEDLQDFIDKLKEAAEELRVEEHVFGETAGAAEKYRLIQEANALGLENLSASQQEMITLLIEEIAQRENSLEAMEKAKDALKEQNKLDEKSAELKAKGIKAQKEAATETRRTVEAMRSEADALRRGTVAHEAWERAQGRAEATQRAYNEVLQAYPEKLKDSTEALKQAASAADEVGRAYDDLVRSREFADEMQKIADAAQETATEVKGYFADALTGLFQGGADGWRRMLDSWWQDWQRYAAQMIASDAYEAIVGGGQRTVFDSSQPSQTAAISNASSVSSLLSLARSGTGGSFGGAALNWGIANMPGTMSTFGLASPATGFYNTGLAGTGYVPSDFGLNLSAGLDAAPWGMVGSLAANALGLAPKNQFVGFGASAVGSIGGATLGTMTGLAAGGPIGAAIGSLLANALASQFGPSASVGPNATASLGYADGAFGVGARGSDNGGNSAQWVGAIQQVADTLNAFMDKAGLRVADPSQSFWKYGLGQGGGAPFGTDPQALLQQILTTPGMFASDDPNVSMALTKTGGSVEQIAADLDFATRFEDALTGMRQATLDYASVVEVQAKAAVESQVAQIEDFLATTERLGLDVAGATDAAAEMVRVLVGIQDAEPPMTALEALMTQYRVQAEAIGPLLESVGISADEAAAGFQRLEAALRDDLQRSIEAEIMSLGGMGVMNQVSALVEQNAIDLRDAVAVGLDSARVDERFGLRIAKAIEGQSLPALEALLASFGYVPAVVERVTAAISDLREAAETEALAAAQAAAAAQAEYRRSLEAEATRLSGRGIFNTITALVEQRAADAASGSDIGLVQDVYAGRLREAFDGQSVAALEAVLAAFGGFPTVVNAATVALQAANDNLAEIAAAEAAQAIQQQIADYQAILAEAHQAAADAARQQLDAAVAAADETERLASAMRSAADDLRATRDSLLVGSLSPLGPRAQLEELASRFATTSAEARLGDQDALAELPALSRTYLEAAREYHDGTQSYAAIFGEVQAALQEAESTADRQASIGEEQLAAAQEQVRLLQEMVDRMSGSTGSSGPLSALAGALAGNGDLGTALQGLNRTQLLSALQLAGTGTAEQEQIRRYIGDSGQQFGQGTVQAQIQAFQQLGEQFQAGTFQGDIMAEQLRLISGASPEALQYFLSVMNPKGQNTGAARDFLAQYLGTDRALQGIPGFAGGGNTGGELARIHRDEWLYTGPPTQVMTASQMQSAMSGSRTDLTPVVNELERQTVYLRQGFERMWQAQQVTNERLDDIERRLRQAA